MPTHPLPREGATEYPIIDPETGEVLALDARDAAEVARLTAETLVQAVQEVRDAIRRRDRAREVLALLMAPGDAVACPGGWAVTVKPGAPPRRALNRQEIQRHAEALAPLGLAPRDVVVQEWPKVSDLTATKARAALARVGLTPETLLLAGEPGRPDVVVIDPPEEPRD